MVAKVKDAKKALSPDDFDQLQQLLTNVDYWRISNGKNPLMCVCVENDWPEYETVWAMIEARATKGND